MHGRFATPATSALLQLDINVVATVSDARRVLWETAIRTQVPVIVAAITRHGAESLLQSLETIGIHSPCNADQLAELRLRSQAARFRVLLTDCGCHLRPRFVVMFIADSSSAIACKE